MAGLTKRRFLLFIFLFIILLAVTVSVLFLITSRGAPRYDVTFFAYSEDGTLFPKIEKREIEATSDSSLLFTLLTALQKGLTEKKLYSPFPEGTTVNNFSFLDGTVYINFSENYLNADEFDIALADYCLAATLSGVKGVYKFVVTVDGQTHPFYENGEFSLSDFVADGMWYAPITRNVTLYYPNENSTALISKKAKISIHGGERIENGILEALFYGAEGEKFLPRVTEEVKLLGLTVRDRVLFLNISDIFLEPSLYSAEEFKLTVYSIVNSITDNSTVNSVQFLFNGRIYGEEDGLLLPLSEPLYKDMTFVSVK